MPRRNSHKRLKAQRTKMYHEQQGLCFYCTKKCVLPEHLDPEIRAKRPPWHMATLEHLDDKFSGLRGTLVGTIRHVMACLRCNGWRGNERVRENWEEQARRSQAGHQKKLDKSLPEAIAIPIRTTTSAETI